MKYHEQKTNSWMYPLVNEHVAIENGHLYLICTSKMVIFHSYVSSPEGISWVSKPPGTGGFHHGDSSSGSQQPEIHHVGPIINL